MKTTIQKLFENFQEYMIEKKAKGFSIGKGKKLYWYLTPNIRLNKFRCLSIERGTLGWPRRCVPEQIIFIHYGD
jgi:hypothetical protein